MTDLEVMPPDDVYASGEYPEVGDLVTKRGHKATRPATVLEITAGRFVTVRWGDSKGTMKYHVSDLVLVTGVEALSVW